MIEIEHFFTPISGYAYLGAEALRAVARDAGARIRQRPVDITKIFEAGGSTPPIRQSNVRRAWRARDMRLWAERRGLPLNDKPRHWPTDAAPAARAIMAVDRQGGAVDAFVSAVLAAVWARDLDIAAASTLALLLGECGIDADATLALAADESVEAACARNTADAIAAGAFGSPFYRIGEQAFFGQDRLDFVQAALRGPT